MAAFPSYPILVEWSSYKVNRNTAVQRTSMEDGFAKQTKRFSRVLVTRSVKYQMTKAEYATFLTWFNTTVNRGSDWFDWTDPNTNTVKTARIVNGQLDEEVPVDPIMSKWDISFKLETWDA